MKIELNTAARLYVIVVSGGCSCLGFDVVYAEACELSRRVVLHRARTGNKEVVEVPRVNEVGTIAQYEQRLRLLAAYMEIDDKETWFDARVPFQAARAIEQARRSGHRVRIFYGDRNTGADWAEEFGTIGRIGRSMGPMHAPILIEDQDVGGGSILSQDVLKLVDLDAGRTLYKSANYQIPRYAITPAGEAFEVRRKPVSENTRVSARFETLELAEAYVAFMAGATHEKDYEMALV
jgi:hypothetical protein